MDNSDRATYSQIASLISPGSSLAAVTHLQGGISASTTLLIIIDTAGTASKYVVRMHGAADRAANANIAADEFKLLLLLQDTNIPAPVPVLHDSSCSILPYPYVVLYYLEGHTCTDCASCSNLPELIALQLAEIHSYAPPDSALSFLPRLQDRFLASRTTVPAHFDKLLGEERIRAALSAVPVYPQSNRSCLLHGDFWLGNILWSNGSITGVIDWENALFGEPLADLANTRLELLWACGEAEMLACTELYLERMALDTRYLPCWDVYAALRFAHKIPHMAESSATAERMYSQAARFTEQAYARMPSVLG